MRNAAAKELRSKLAKAKRALSKADFIIGWVSMTSWEREALKRQMDYIRRICDELEVKRA